MTRYESGECSKANLFLHVGHGKTGTSYLQSILAKNKDLLLEYDIFYPQHKNYDKALRGQITSGNAAGLTEGSISNFISQKINNKVINCLFSNEGLWKKLLRDPADFSLLNERFNLKIIFFVRDPLEYVFSSYGQSVKREGQVESLEKSLNKFSNLKNVCLFLKTCADLNVDISVINYSAYDDIKKPFFSSLLGNDCDDFIKKLVLPENKIVNRSLTRFEYLLQRKFNFYLGRSSSKFISDALVDLAPDIKSELEVVSQDKVMNFISSFDREIKFVNSFLSSDEKINISFNKLNSLSTSDPCSFYVSEQQIDILASSISSYVKKIKPMVYNKEKSPVNLDADLLRNIALKYETQKTLSLEDAHYLMGLAHIARPHGPLIKKKLDIYTNELTK